MTWFVGPKATIAEVTLTLTPTGDGLLNGMNGGDPIVITQSEATQIGTWNPAGYNVNHLNLYYKDGHLGVFFRPEVDGSRYEVIVENCSFREPITVPAGNIATSMGSSTLTFTFDEDHGLATGMKMQPLEALSLDGVSLTQWVEKTVTVVDRNTITVSGSGTGSAGATSSTTFQFSSTPDFGPFDWQVDWSGGSEGDSSSGHWYGGRWVWESAERELVSGDMAAWVAAQQAAGLIPPYGDHGIAFDSYSPTITPYVPMGGSTVTKGMGSTGERDDIGPLTESCAQALLYWLGVSGIGSDGETLMWHWANSALSIPVHIRDENTNRPPDLTTDYPNLHHHAPAGNFSNYYLSGPPSSMADGWEPDSAHAPSLSYIPFLARGNLRDLEELQHFMTWMVAAVTSYRDAGGNPTLYSTQERGMGWSLRNLLHACLASPETDTTGCLLEKAYWEDILDNTRTFLEDRALNPEAPGAGTFGYSINIIRDSDNNTYTIGTWETCFLSTSALACYAAGYTEWDTFAAYTLKGTEAITGYTAGWDRYIVPYRYAVQKGFKPETNYIGNFITTAGSDTVTMEYVDHYLLDDNQITIKQSGDGINVGGITLPNGTTYTVTRVDDDYAEFTIASPASSNDSKTGYFWAEQFGPEFDSIADCYDFNATVEGWPETPTELSNGGTALTRADGRPGYILGVLMFAHDTELRDYSTEIAFYLSELPDNGAQAKWSFNAVLN